jgi:predicted porin
MVARHVDCIRIFAGASALRGAHLVEPLVVARHRAIYICFSTGSAKPAIHTVGLMADYNLSKRTDVYLQAIYQLVTGDHTGSSLDRAYVPGAQDLSSTSRQVLVRAALRHAF